MKKSWGTRKNTLFTIKTVVRQKKNAIFMLSKACMHKTLEQLEMQWTCNHWETKMNIIHYLCNNVMKPNAIQEDSNLICGHAYQWNINFR